MMDLSGGGEYEMNLRVLILCYVRSCRVHSYPFGVVRTCALENCWKLCVCVLTLYDFVQQFIFLIL